MLTVALLPVLFVVTLGYAAGRFRLMNNTHIADLNAFVMMFAVPLSLLAALGSLTRDELIGAAPLAGLFLVTMSLTYVAWFFFAWRLGFTQSDAAVQALTISFPNLAAVALPLLTGFDGRTGLAEVAAVLGVGAAVPTAVTLVLIDMARGNQGARSGRLALAMRHGLLKPLVLAPAAGAVLAATAVVLPASVLASFRLLGGASAGGALFITGLVVSAQKVEINRTTAVAVLVMNVVRPVAVWALTSLFNAPAGLAHAAILMAATPAGFFGILFGVSNNIPVTTTGSMIGLSTLVSILTLPIIILFLFGR